MSKVLRLTPNTNNNFIALRLVVSSYDNSICFTFYLETPICFYFDRDSDCLLPAISNGKGHYSVASIDKESDYQIEGLFDIKSKAFNHSTSIIGNVSPDSQHDLLIVFKTILQNNYKYKKALQEQTNIVIKENDTDITNKFSL